MMRKFLLIALACAPIFLLAQVERTVLIEQWTNASCAPCAAQNPAFNVLLDANTDQVVAIKYQWFFPGFDPFQEQNPEEINNRGEYYGLSGVPTAWIDGTLPDNDYADGAGAWDITPTSGYAGGPYGYNQAVLDFAASQTTPISMTLTHDIDEDTKEVVVTVAITNQSAEDFTMDDGRLHVVLLEREVEFDSPPGTTDERIFTNVMRKMYPNEAGSMVPTIAAGETWDFMIRGAIPDYIYGLNELRVAAFVQDNTTTEVWQAGVTEPQMIVNAIDVGLINNLTAEPQGLCGAAITPVVQFTNAGDVEVTQATIAARINGEIAETQEYSEALAPGATVDITFSEIVLTESTSSLTFTVEDVNNGVGLDINGFNNSLDPTFYSTISDTPLGTSLEEDMENYDNFAFPGNSIVTPTEGIANSFFTVSAANFQTPPPIALGGYGLSEQSILIDFFNWNPDAAGSPPFADLIYQKVDLTTADGAQLSFDRAATGYPFAGGESADGLDVSISTDCGENWVSVWSAAGGDLYTAPSQTGFYAPQAESEWTTEDIDVSDFIGNEVIVRFRATTNWGNTLYMDNINLSGVVNTEELTEVSDIRLFPNPAQEFLQVNFDLEEASQLQVEVFNVTGQRVQQLGAANYNTGANQLNLDVSQLSNGVYFLRMFNTDRELSRRFVVQH